MRSIKKLICGEEADELVEFALTAVPFFLIFFAIIEFGLYMYTGASVANAAEKGARYAMVHGAGWSSVGTCATTTGFDCFADSTNVTQYVLNMVHPGLTLQAGDVTTAPPSNTGYVTVTPLTTTASGGGCTAYTKGCQIKVQIRYTFGMLLPFLPHLTSLPLTSAAIETIQK